MEAWTIKEANLYKQRIIDLENLVKENNAKVEKGFAKRDTDLKEFVIDFNIKLRALENKIPKKEEPVLAKDTPLFKLIISRMFKK